MRPELSATGMNRLGASMPPTQQRLDTDEHIAGERELRLILEKEFTLGDGPTQLRRQRDARTDRFRPGLACTLKDRTKPVFSINDMSVGIP
jgi:hypothetical protein